MKAIIFDMDGTLTDSERFWSLTPYRFLESQGVEERRGLSAPWFMRSSKMSYTNILANPDMNIDWKVDDCARWGRDYMYNEVYPQGVPMKPGGWDTLKAAKALGVPMCLLSATERQPLQYTLYKLQMVDYFTFWETTAHQPMNKNHIALFARCAERMGVALEDCVVIEDSLYSMKTAHAAGCKVWAIADDKHLSDREEIMALADRYFEDHAGLSKALREDFLNA